MTRTMDAPPIELVLITGMSGSGKSVALTALEDLGFYCVDNLPPELLDAFIALEQSHRAERVAIAMDVRSARSLPGLPARLDALRHHPGRPVHLTTLFLDAATDALVRRFSETRRRHPLSLKQSDDQRRALTEAIEHERELLAELREHALVLDTSIIRPAQLRSHIKELLGTLEARERQIIVLRYFKDLTQARVAELIGVSQVQVSRLESRILKRLREQAGYSGSSASE